MYLLPSQLSLFQGISDWELKEVLDALPLRQFPKGFLLYDESETSGELFAVLRGKVELVKKNAEVGFTLIQTCEEGSLFGEQAYLCGTARSHSAVAQEESVLLELSPAWLNEIQSRFPVVRDRILDLYREKILTQLLSKISLFKSLSENELVKLASKFQLRIAEDGEMLISEGEETLDFMIIKKGLVSVLKRQKQKTLMLSQLGAGEVFGEMAAILGQPRSASIKTVGKVEYLILEGAEFKKILKESPMVLDGMKDLIKSRSDQTRQILDQISSQVIADLPGTNKDLFTQGLSVGELNLRGVLENVGGKYSVILQRLSSSTAVFNVVEPVSFVPDIGSVSVWMMSSPDKKFKDIKECFPLQLSFEDIHEGQHIFSVVLHAGVEAKVSKLILLCAQAKLRGLMYPEYSAATQNILCTVSVNKGNTILESGLETISLTHGKIRTDTVIEAATVAQLAFHKNQQAILSCKGICLGTVHHLAEFQFECETPEQKRALQKIIQDIRDADRPPSLPAHSQMSGIVIERKFADLQDFVKNFVAYADGDKLTLKHLGVVTKDTHLKIAFIVGSGHNETKLVCPATVVGHSAGEIVVKSPSFQRDVKAFMERLTEELSESVNTELWEKRKNDLLGKTSKPKTSPKRDTPMVEVSSTSSPSWPYLLMYILSLAITAFAIYTFTQPKIISPKPDITFQKTP